MLDRAFPRGLLSLCLLTVALPSSAQSPDAPSPPGSHIDTLQIGTHIVLTDVTVTDSHGNPVHGLTSSDFHIFDDNHPQPISSFEEHTSSLAPIPPSTPTIPNLTSNDFLLHPPSPVNVILIDTTTIELIDQMYLYEELTRFVRTLPSGQPVAIYCRSGNATLLLQNFTDDHALLVAAIRRAVPQFRNPDSLYTDDIDTLLQMANYLSQIPGRKNILWFPLAPPS
jgi:VWFA-related protein